MIRNLLVALPSFRRSGDLNADTSTVVTTSWRMSVLAALVQPGVVVFVHIHSRFDMGFDLSASEMTRNADTADRLWGMQLRKSSFSGHWYSLCTSGSYLQSLLSGHLADDALRWGMRLGRV